MLKQKQIMNFRQTVPPRWIPCPNYGEMIPKTHLVPLKTPLGDDYSRLLWDKHNFTIEDFKQGQMRLGRNTKYFISLTYSSRYYREEELGDIKLISIKCRGRGETPNQEQFEMFKNKVNTILPTLQENDVIGVHCTHGFNRTGFMIVRYLIEQLGYSLKDSLEIFADARHGGIYKEDYLQELYQIYKQVFSGIAPQPDWFHPDPKILPFYSMPASETIEYDSVQSDQNNMGNIGCNKPLSTLMNSKLKKIVQKMCKASHVDNFPGSQPISLGRNEFSTLKANSTYRATYKSDGVRYFLLAHEGHTYITDRKYKFREIDLVLVNKKGQHLKETLIDGELVQEGTETNFRLNFLIFDVVCFEYLILIDNNWDYRMSLAKSIIDFRNEWKELAPEMFGEDEFELSIKKQWPLYELSDLQNYMKTEVLHPTDGIIFTPLNMKYIIGKCEQILKWKPLDMNSVDFLAEMKNGICYLSIFRANRNKTEDDDDDGQDFEYVPISVLYINNTKMREEIENSTKPVIVECIMDINDEMIDKEKDTIWHKAAWKPLRIRTDKEKSNDYSTFIGVFETIRDNITFRELIQDFR